MLLPHERVARQEAQLEKQRFLGGDKTKARGSDMAAATTTTTTTTSSSNHGTTGFKDAAQHHMSTSETLSTSPAETLPPPYSETYQHENGTLNRTHTTFEESVRPSMIDPNAPLAGPSSLNAAANQINTHPIQQTPSPSSGIVNRDSDAELQGPMDERRGYQGSAPMELQSIEEADMGFDDEGDTTTESPALLSDWEVVETLGTGTFGRVLLVRLRPPYRSSSYHPIFPNLKFSPANPDEPTPEQTAYADAQAPHYAMKVLSKSEIVKLKQVEHINSERAILERVRHPFLVEL